MGNYYRNYCDECGGWTIWEVGEEVGCCKCNYGEGDVIKSEPKKCPFWTSKEIKCRFKTSRGNLKDMSAELQEHLDKMHGGKWK